MPREESEINPEKFKLKLSEVPYKGHLLTSTGLQPDPEKVRPVKEIPIPDGATCGEKVKAVKHFLGFVN